MKISKITSVYKKLIYFLITIALTLGLSISFQSLLADWTAPTAVPPGVNTPAPINMGINQQTKQGDLDLVQGFSVDNTTFVVDNVNNRVGIGTNNPAAKLHIGGSNQELRLDYNDTNDHYGSLRWAGLQLGNNGVNRIVAGRTDAGGSLNFYVNNTNDAANYGVVPNGTMALRIESNGDVSIPNTFFADVSASRVGIGTNNPGAKLEVSAGPDTSQILWEYNIRNSGNANLTDYGAGLKLKISSDAGIEANKWVGIAGVAGTGWANQTDMVFYVNPTAVSTPIEKVRITGAGNIGIGTNNPAARLQIGDSTANGNNYIIFGKRKITAESALPFIGHDSVNSTASGLGLGAHSSSGGINFYTGNGGIFDASHLRMRIESNGDVSIPNTFFADVSAQRVGIGAGIGSGVTTPGAGLHLWSADDGTDQIKISSTDGGLNEYMFMGANSSSNYGRLGYWDGNTSAFGNMQIEGSVGIGKIPAGGNELDVAGDIKASGTVCDGGGRCLDTISMPTLLRYGNPRGKAPETEVSAGSNSWHRCPKGYVVTGIEKDKEGSSNDEQIVNILCTPLSCDSTYEQACGATECINAGTYNCEGVCVGTSPKNAGTACNGGTQYCDGNGTCDNDCDPGGAVHPKNVHFTVNTNYCPDCCGTYECSPPDKACPNYDDDCYYDSSCVLHCQSTIADGTCQTNCDGCPPSFNCENGTCKFEGAGPCFVAGTKVLMVDGQYKNIEDIKIGEKVRGEGGGINTVLDYERHKVGGRRSYIINDKVEFMGDHPFLSKEGWKVTSLKEYYAALRVMGLQNTADLKPSELKVGDILITKDGKEDVLTIKRNDRAAEEVVYDFRLDGDSTYIADGFIVRTVVDPVFER